jgi:hypothetical protein
MIIIRMRRMTMMIAIHHKLIWAVVTGATTPPARKRIMLTPGNRDLNWL